VTVEDLILPASLAVGGSLASAVGVGVALVLLPADAFDEAARKSGPAAGYTLSRIVAKILKNLVGVLLIGLGVILIFAPGSGLLTILLGLFFVDFPGKQRLERAIISRPRVFKAVNELRGRFGKAPFTRGGGASGEPAPPR
jgi:hypothetical protein